MKANTHPQFFEEAQVICACGNKFTTGSTLATIHVELCSNCHPFYTGEQRFVDSASRIQKFQQKQEKAATVKYVPKRIKKLEEKKKSSQAPQTLREMLAALK
jgi:large subunit ribosomal protein L31